MTYNVFVGTLNHAQVCLSRSGSARPRMDCNFNAINWLKTATSLTLFIAMKEHSSHTDQHNGLPEKPFSIMIQQLCVLFDATDVKCVERNG